MPELHCNWMILGCLVALLLLLLLRSHLSEAYSYSRLRDKYLSWGLHHDRKRREGVLLTYFHTAVTVFELADVEFWLDCGTLLGFVREGRILPHDFDIDLAFHEKDAPKVLRASRAVIKPPLRLEETTGRHRGPKFKIRGLGLHCDLYSYAALPGALLRPCEVGLGTLEGRDVPKALVLPLCWVPRAFGRRAGMPRQAVQYLEHKYGYLGMASP